MKKSQIFWLFLFNQNTNITLDFHFITFDHLTNKGTKDHV